MIFLLYLQLNIPIISVNEMYYYLSILYCYFFIYLFVLRFLYLGICICAWVLDTHKTCLKILQLSLCSHVPLYPVVLCVCFCCAAFICYLISDLSIIYIYICIYICIFIYIYIYIYMYMYIYLFFLFFVFFLLFFLFSLFSFFF